MHPAMIRLGPSTATCALAPVSARTPDTGLVAVVELPNGA
jgi:hypothetical protein